MAGRQEDFNYVEMESKHIIPNLFLIETICIKNSFMTARTVSSVSLNVGLTLRIVRTARTIKE